MMIGRSKRSLVLGAVLAGGALGLGSLSLSYADGRGSRDARVVLRDQAGTFVGVAKLSQERRGKVEVRVEADDLPAGFHGFHVHAVGQCVPPFTSAGGHYNPSGASHGDHAGDMPVLLVNDDGSGDLEFTTDRFTVRELFDADGSAIIVHAARDNLANIPERYHSHTEDVFGPDSATLGTGDAGARLACGVVQRSSDDDSDSD
jgi:Cu-Zn family superoxide dismutase